MGPVSPSTKVLHGSPFRVAFSAIDVAVGRIEERGWIELPTTGFARETLAMVEVTPDNSFLLKLVRRRKQRDQIWRNFAT